MLQNPEDVVDYPGPEEWRKALQEGQFWVEGPAPHDIDVPLYSRSDLRDQKHPIIDAPVFSTMHPYCPMSVCISSRVLWIDLFTTNLPPEGILAKGRNNICVSLSMEYPLHTAKFTTWNTSKCSLTFTGCLLWVSHCCEWFIPFKPLNNSIR